MIDKTILKAQLAEQLEHLVVKWVEELEEQAPLSRQETVVRGWMAQAGQQILTQVIDWQSQQA